MEGQSRRPAVDRFTVSESVVRFDRLMNRIIQFGGVAIIAAVLLIFVFIVGEVMPLVRRPRVTPGGTHTLPPGLDVVAIGMDDHAELPFFVSPDAEVWFLDTVTGGAAPNRGVFSLSPGLPESFQPTVVHFSPRHGKIYAGADDGRIALIQVEYLTDFPDGRTRRTGARLEVQAIFPAGVPGAAIDLMAYGDGGRQRLAATVQQVNAVPVLHVLRIDQTRTLLGAGALVAGEQIDLSHLLTGTPQIVLVPWEANAVLIADTNGTITYVFDDPNEGFVVRQRFTPFADLADQRITSMDFLLSDVSIVVTNLDGATRTFSLYRDPDTGVRVWDHFRTFADIPGDGTFFSPSLRNRAFLIGRERRAAIRYNTTGSTRLELDLPFTVHLAALGNRYHGLLFLDDTNRVHWWELDDPHPRAGWKTFFRRIRYEGQADPSFVWQSSGATDDFEAKLSMVPLIFGTLKGTLYAMLFSLPVALLAAIYTSQFLRPDLKRFVKPVMEIMASLPSVVLGFIAALWLAPIISNAVPSVLATTTAVILSSIIAGELSWRLPRSVRAKIRPGYEFLLLVPILVLSGWLGWRFGAHIEETVFVVSDPVTGSRIADFRLWFTNVIGGDFEQRNSLVVGFVMGFAVIPLIFTITEDSLSNVPEAFRSGSLALGASRWQTAVRVVVPTAAAGIFSAVMIGLGRAVGETMIVVMATGNVPVTDLNIFTGMRTLSANIAVELPEAPWRSTLYRSLFLGSLLLFSFTFVVNTGAELLRQRLRERFKAVE